MEFATKITGHTWYAHVHKSFLDMYLHRNILMPLHAHLSKVCVYVCMYILEYVCLYVCVCMCACMYWDICVCMYVCMFVFVLAYMYGCMCI
jgi:hypothetical protein